MNRRPPTVGDYTFLAPSLGTSLHQNENSSEIIETVVNFDWQRQNVYPHEIWSGEFWRIWAIGSLVCDQRSLVLIRVAVHECEADVLHWGLLFSGELLSTFFFFNRLQKSREKHSIVYRPNNLPNVQTAGKCFCHSAATKFCIRHFHTMWKKSDCLNYCNDSQIGVLWYICSGYGASPLSRHSKAPPLSPYSPSDVPRIYFCLSICQKCGVSGRTIQ